MNMKEKPAAGLAHLIVMDSGVGGLNVLKTLLNARLGCAVTFVADSAWMPYGEKDPNALRARLLQLVGHVLNERGYENPYLLFACNTASAVWEGIDPAVFGQHGIRPDRVIDILRPTLGLLMRELHVFRKTPMPYPIGLMATALTVASGVYPVLAAQLFPFGGPESLAWLPVPCYDLAQAVEGQNTLDDLDTLLARYIQPFEKAPPHALLLGCTHYLVLKERIQAALPNTVMIDPSEALVYVVRQRLGLPLVPDEHLVPSTSVSLPELPSYTSLELLQTGQTDRLALYCDREYPLLQGYPFHTLKW
jgi:glutamate racemase